MIRKIRHLRRKEPPELNITAFLNLMVVLVPFLLITAVFSRITILQLNLPTDGQGSDAPQDVKLTLEVIVRQQAIELGDGKNIIKRMEYVEDEPDIASLADVLLQIKGTYPDKLDATLLLEPGIKYDVLVQVMDAVRVAEVFQDGALQLVELFPQISIGDAPLIGQGN